MTEPPRSQHPADRLIRELVATGRDASDDEVRAILERIATAPFSTLPARVMTEHRGYVFGGRPLGAREPSLLYHLFKRVVLDEQWPIHTSEQQYLDDLHSVARATGSQLLLYERHAGAMAAMIAHTRVAIPADRLGPNTLQGIVIVYAADRGTLVSGYQFSELAELSIPEDARWYSGR